MSTGSSLSDQGAFVEAINVNLKHLLILKSNDAQLLKESNQALLDYFAKKKKNSKYISNIVVNIDQKKINYDLDFLLKFQNKSYKLDTNVKNLIKLLGIRRGGNLLIEKCDKNFSNSNSSDQSPENRNSFESAKQSDELGHEKSVKNMNSFQTNQEFNDSSNLINSSSFTNDLNYSFYNDSFRSEVSMSSVSSTLFRYNVHSREFVPKDEKKIDKIEDKNSILNNDQQNKNDTKMTVFHTDSNVFKEDTKCSTESNVCDGFKSTKTISDLSNDANDKGIQNPVKNNLTKVYKRGINQFSKSFDVRDLK